MPINWDSKSTYQLEIMLASLLRYAGNAKTDREKRNSARTISEVKRILAERKKK